VFMIVGNVYWKYFNEYRLNCYRYLVEEFLMDVAGLNYCCFCEFTI